ncbi:MAG: phage-shock protein [Thermodesulfobacteriota bacterium]|nr:phage-shock protein [Thermodesulfobacteriota bacterium]
MHGLMNGALIIAFFTGGAILVLTALGLIIITVIRAVKNEGLSKKERTARAEETRMIEDIFKKLSKMEDRVETLETILMDRQQTHSHGRE